VIDAFDKKRAGSSINVEVFAVEEALEDGKMIFGDYLS
jgi:hypothetical protein